MCIIYVSINPYIPGMFVNRYVWSHRSKITKRPSTSYSDIPSLYSDVDLQGNYIYVMLADTKCKTEKEYILVFLMEKHILATDKICYYEMLAKQRWRTSEQVRCQ